MEAKKLFDKEDGMSVAPRKWNHLIYFDFGPKGKHGSACWDTSKNAWKPVKCEVGNAQKQWLERVYNLMGNKEEVK